MQSNYIKSTKQQFLYYKMLGEKTFDQLSDDELFWQYNDVSNTMSVMVKHLWGNMMSRWTDFLTSDGEKDTRNRDGEFVSDIKTRNEMMTKWEEGWKCLFTALDTVNTENWETTIYIRNQGHSIAEAVNRQMMHYAYHIGQMVYLGRMIKGDEWLSLSIPKGDSKAYNNEKFAQEKNKQHFTDEYIKK